MRTARRASLLPILAALSLAALLTGRARAQEEPQPPPPGEVTVADIESRIASLANATGLEEAARTALTTTYRDALAQLQRAAEWAARAQDLQQTIDGAPKRLEAVREELAQPPPGDVAPPSTATLAILHRTLTAADADLQSGRTQVEELRAEASRRTERRTLLANQFAGVRKRIAELDDALAVPLATDAPEAAAAGRLLAEAQRRALVLELRVGELEVTSYEVRGELLQARRDKALRAVTVAEKRTSDLREAVAAARRRETEVAAEEARQLRIEAATRAPEVRPLAERNEELAALRSGDQGLGARLERRAQDLARVRTQLAALRERYGAMRHKAEVVGLGSAMGLLLRREYDALPDPSGSARARYAQDVAEAQLQQILLQEERDRFSDVDARLTELLAGRPPDGELAGVGRELLVSRRKLLDSAEADTGLLVSRLVDLEAAVSELDAVEREYRGWIEERILWVRSVTGGDLPDPVAAIAASRWLVSREAWAEAPAPSGRTLAGLVGLLAIAAALRWLLGLRLRGLWTQHQAAPLASFAPTRTATLLTALMAALPAAVLWACSSWLVEFAPRAPVAAAVGAGLWRAGATLAVLQLLSLVVSAQGLGRHLGWPDDGLLLLRRHLLWFTPIAVTTTFVVNAMEQQQSALWSDSLGRSAFTAGALSLSVFHGLTLRPGGPLLANYCRSSPDNILTRFRHGWFLLAVLVPAGLCLGALLGYYYTATRLARCLQLTFALVLGVVLLRGLGVRWLKVTRRRVAIDEVRAAQEAEQERPEGDPAEVVREAADVKGISAQTAAVIRTAVLALLLAGMFFIWSGVFPALRRLSSVEVWAATESEAAEQVGPAPVGVPLPGPVGEQPAAERVVKAKRGVSLADVGVALIALVLTVTAVKNLPGFLELVVLDRIDMDPGARYAMVTLTRYGLILFGTAFAANSIGLSWESVQWLAAALTFGLAFGLQEIFANFMSGLILLFERPIRIGDVVTIGDTTGVVTRLQIRATTIRDYLQRELVVPNREFVTGRVMNWSLTNLARVVLPVGVAYGSDTTLARQLLLQVAQQNPRVLAEPTPRALFLGFGASSLDLELHVVIPGTEDKLALRDEIHGAIEAAFRANGIEIAFPQLDLHVRTGAQLLAPAQSGPAAAAQEPPPASGPPAAAAPGDGA